MTYRIVSWCVWCGHASHRAGQCRAVVRLIAVGGHPECPCLCSADSAEAEACEDAVTVAGHPDHRCKDHR